jgi:non-specific serine/threonine protein kinase
MQGDLGRGRPLLEEGVAHFRAVGDPWGIGLALLHRAVLDSAAGDDQAARPLYEESIARFRTVGDRWLLAMALSWAGDLALVQEDYATAGAWFEEGLALAREVGSPVYAGYNLAGAGAVALLRGDPPRAAARFGEYVALARELAARRGVAVGLAGLAGAAAAQGRAARAARLLGAADALQEAIGFALDPSERAVHDRAETTARGALDEAAFAGAYAAGRALPWEDAVDDALAPEEAAPGGAARALLSAREREVAALIAGGLTNRQIAAALVIAERTADTHVQHILNKLGFTARTQVAAWAAAQGLVAASAD